MPSTETVQTYAQLGASSPIKHVVVIVQENRTPDNLFQGVPGADIATTAKDSEGKIVKLHAVSLAAGYDLAHGNGAFVNDYDNGKMDGFDRGLSRHRHLRPFGYVPVSESKPYLEMARQYVFADHMFQTNRGPSFPAHLYIIAGRATDAKLKPYIVSENPSNNATRTAAPGGCDTPISISVKTINAETGLDGPRVWPCFDPPVLSDFLDSKGVSWRYYQNQPGAGLWTPYDAVRHVRYGPDWKNVVERSVRIFTDVAQNRLAGVTWVVPAAAYSDHAGKSSTTHGPSWVAAIVNSIGLSPYWSSTAIFIVWDDWGGWYDHVKPPSGNAYELGFRVPLIVISPYARREYVSKVPHEFGSLLAFTEETFGIPKGALDSSDRRSDDLMDAFDFTQQPRHFRRIKAPPFIADQLPPTAEEDP